MDTNMGIDVLLERVADDPAVVTFVGADWPIPAGTPAQVIPVHPVPHYPWYAVWRTTNTHPLLPALIRHLQHTGQVPDPQRDESWLPAAVRHRRATSHGAPRERAL